MRSEWPTKKLESVASVIDSRHKTPAYSDSGFPMVRVVDVKGGALDLTGTKKVDQEVYEDFSRGRDPQVGDLVISRVGSYGIVSYVASDEKFCLGQNTAFIIPQINSGFLYYQLNSPFVKSQIDQMVVGAVQKTISLKSIRNFDILVPEEAAQEKIANILGSLDEKIELNRQINATLESMAQALFKSWFVDFDPVIDNALAAGNPIPEPLQARAKKRAALLAAASAADTRSASATDNAHPTQTAPHTQPGTTPPGTPLQPLPADLRALFPDGFVFNEEMGWVPEGWEVGSVGNEFDVTMGQSPPGDTYNESGEGTPFFQGRADFGFRFPANRVFCIAPKRMANKGDTLVSVRAPVGDVNMAAEDCCIGRGVAAVRHKSGSISYTYYAMRQLRERFAVFEGEGTVFGSINQRDFKALPQIAVSCDVISSFSELAGSFDSKVESQSMQISCLTDIRDSLLPKLLSGQIQLSEVDKAATEDP